jgi:ADP-ribose pyrophosphatase YjhB (NUDIX family)
MMHEEVVFHFCPVCGGKLQSRVVKSEEPARLVCSRCEFVYYLDPKVVACSIVEIDGRIVLLKRGIEPQKGKWVMPGGYVDRGEEVRAAAVRETEEECGLKTRIRGLHGVYSYPGRITVVIAYLAEAVGGDLKAGDESVEARLVHPADIPWAELAFQSTTDALTEFCKRKKQQDRGSAGR